MEYEDILNALKNGNVPSDGTIELCIGRDKEINEINYLLDKIKEGKSFTKFLNGEFGAGKSFFLKVIEEMAFEQNYVVSWVTLSNDIPFNKIDVVYKNIAKNMKCKTGTSLEHIIERWITRIKMEVMDESHDLQNQNDMIKKYMTDDLSDVRKYSNSIAVAIENYYQAINSGNNELANFIQAWLRGDPNIPFTIKRKFGVKGDVDKETALKYLEALSIFIKSIGYSGFVVIFDEAEFIMNLHTKKIRDVAYNYIRDLYDDCNLGKFINSLFLFAGTPGFFDDPKLGVPSYGALDDRIQDVIDSNYKDLRKPILDLEGFKRDNLIEISGKLMLMHEETYKWNATDLINPILSDMVGEHEERASLTGGKVTPRTFIRSFISVLDTVQQNQSHFKDSKEILEMFNGKESELEEVLEDDW